MMKDASEEEMMKQKLSPLSHITMPDEAERELHSNLDQAIQDYQAQTSKRVSPIRLLRRTLPMTFAAVFVMAAGSITYFAIHHPVKNHTGSSSSHDKLTSQKTSALHNDNVVVKTHYTSATMKKVTTIARQKHVTPYLPQKVLPGGSATIVKPGANSLVIDYKRMWIIESNKSFKVLQNQASLPKQKVQLADGSTATLFRYESVNNVLYFKTGQTYIAIQHLSGTVPTKKELIAVANSLTIAK